MAGLDFFVFAFVLVVIGIEGGVIRFGGFLNILEDRARQKIFLLEFDLLDDLGVFIQLAAFRFLRKQFHLHKVFRELSLTRAAGHLLILLRQGFDPEFILANRKLLVANDQNHLIRVGSRSRFGCRGWRRLGAQHNGEQEKRGAKFHYFSIPQ